MMCARCDQPIQGEPRPVEKVSATGAGSTLYVCPTFCTPVPHRTVPATSPLSRHARRLRR